MLGTSKTTIEDYDAIGFDMDLCLARYKFNKFLQILFECAAIKLVKDHDYPSDLFPNDEDMDFFLSFAGRGVIDLKTLYILKLGKGGLVLRAFDGYERLTSEQIKATYGPEGRVEGPDFDNLDFGKNFYFCSDLFKSDYILLVIRIKELLKKKGKYPSIEEKSGWDILRDFHETSTSNYHHFHKKYLPPEEFGYYFPMLKVNPKRYLHKIDPRLLEKLRKLKENGKLVFLITNAHVGYYEIIFPFITQDIPWAEDLLDYVGMNGTKPLFFTEGESRKFYSVNYGKRDLRGTHNLDFQANKFFLEGNAVGLTEDMKKRLGKDDVRVLYFGDNSTGDMKCCHMKGWDNAFIYEEMSEIDPTLTQREDYYDFSRQWGSWIRDLDVNGNMVDTLLYDKCLNQFSKAFPRTCSQQCLDFLTLKHPHDSS